MMKKTLRLLTVSVLLILCIGALLASAADVLTDGLKADIKTVEGTINEVFTEGADTINLSRYGMVDSESHFTNYAVVAPLAKPKFDAIGFNYDDYIFVAYGDGRGTVIDVFMSYQMNKSTLVDGERISCVKYDAATDEYTQGTIEVDYKTLTGSHGPDSYFVLLRTTFAPIEDVTDPELPIDSGSGSGSGSDDDDEEEDYGAEVALRAVTPKRMSIRLENGTILKNSDSFNLSIGESVKFQMCSNNWDNNLYDDEGNGIAGTVVYTVRVSERFDERSYDPSTHTFVIPRGDLVMRTDVNKCFMAYKYHFENGDYNKQTGIEKVVNVPLESLSVNLPLGSTITSDAYKALEQIDTDNVFIENAEDSELSYTDYYWEY